MTDGQNLNHALADGFRRMASESDVWKLFSCPFMIFTSFVLQISRIRSRTRVAASPARTGFRYFVVHTRWRWISYTVCAPRRYSAIHQA